MIEKYINKTAYEIFKIFVEDDSNIASVTILEYGPSLPVQSRFSPSQSEVSILERALQLRSQLDMPFWDSAMVACFSSAETPVGLLKAVLCHRTYKDNLITFSRDEVLQDAVINLCLKATDKLWYSAISEILLYDGTKAHIPFLDFHCPQSERNAQLAITVMRQLLPAGALLLESGKSYHGYGLKLVSEAELIDFLAKAVLFAPITDRAYVAHQILERKSAIRLSQGGRLMKAPRVIWAG